MPYLIVNSIAKAEAISERLYDLRRPTSDPSDVTRFWLRVIEHPDGRGALDVSDVKDARIDPQAVPDVVVDHLKQWMTRQEQEDAKQVIRNARGKRVRLAQIMPQKVKDRVQSDAAMEADGWPIGANLDTVP